MLKPSLVLWQRVVKLPFSATLDPCGNDELGGFVMIECSRCYSQEGSHNGGRHFRIEFTGLGFQRFNAEDGGPCRLRGGLAVRPSVRQ